jgi:hypothetical protein
MKRLALLAALACAAPAAAQMMPGVVAPTTAKDAMSIGQMLGCTFAATGRPSAVSSADTTGSVGLTHRDRAPAAILSAAGMSGEGTLAFTVDNPEGEVWILNNPRQRRCAVATVAGNLADVEARFVGDFARGMMEYRETRASEAGTRRYQSRAIGLTVTLRSSTGPDVPFVVITEGRH